MGIYTWKVFHWFVLGKYLWKVSLSKEGVKKQKKWSSIEEDKKKQKGCKSKMTTKSYVLFFLQTDFRKIINQPSDHTTVMVLRLALTRSDPVSFLMCSLNQYLNTDFLTENTWVLWHLPNQNKLLYLRLKLLHHVTFCCPSNFFFSSPLTRIIQCGIFLLFLRHITFLLL